MFQFLHQQYSAATSVLLDFWFMQEMRLQTRLYGWPWKGFPFNLECFQNFQLKILSKWKAPQVLDFLQWSNGTVVISHRLSDHSKCRCNGQLGETSRIRWFRSIWGNFAKFWPLLIQYFIGRAKNISFWIFLQWKLTLLTVLIKHNLICAL